MAEKTRSRSRPIGDRIRKGVIPVAGIGSRFLPASKAVAKELFPIVDQPALSYCLEEAVAAGIEEVILVTSPRKVELTRYLERDLPLETSLAAQGKEDLLQRLRDTVPPLTVTTVIQKEPRGLGHAIGLARGAVGDEPFAVILPDDLIRAHVPCLVQMMPFFQEKGCGTVAVREVPPERVPHYGIVAVEETSGRLHSVTTLVEKPALEGAPSHLAVIGRYLLPPAVFSILETVPRGSLGEIQLTDALQVLAKEEGLFAYEFEGEHYDTGNPLGFIVANVGYGLARPEIAASLKTYLRQWL